MAVLLSVSPSQYAFINSPIVVTASNLTFSSTSMRKAYVVVTVSGKEYTFSQEPVDRMMSVDISSALRSAMHGRNPVSSSGTITADPAVTASVTAYTTSLYNGTIKKESMEGSVDIKVYYGTMSEIDRSSGTVITLPFKRTRKPSSGEQVPVGHSCIIPYINASGTPVYDKYTSTSSSKDKNVAIGTGTPSARSVYVTDYDMQEFLFVNSLGAVEDACAICLHSLSYTIEKDVYARKAPVSYTATPSLVSSRPDPYASYEMSSGHVTSDWAQWWIMEFLASDQHWMKIDGRYLPVTITPKNATITAFDTSKSDSQHIEFTAKVSLSGW